MIYLDTSVVVAALTNERRSPEILYWLAAAIEPCIISDWVITEFAAALAMKLRMQLLGGNDVDATRERLGLLTSESLRVISPVVDDFRRATGFVERHLLGLRGGDALHLAIADRVGAELRTLDVSQAKGGEALGLRAGLI